MLNNCYGCDKKDKMSIVNIYANLRSVIQILNGIKKSIEDEVNKEGCNNEEGN